jgi:transcriptional regulator with XRE-family HTH domain
MPTAQSELAHFLRTHRARLQPEQVGLTRGVRRRTPGLRRDEVAQLAGFSVAWYSWLEQGRDIRLSRPSARRLATALQLDPIETAHLLALAESEAAETQVSIERCAVSGTLANVVDAQGDNPAYVMDDAWDVLKWNASSGLIFGGFGSERLGQANALRYMFLDPLARLQLVDWSGHAARMTAQFRQTSDHLTGCPRQGALISELRAGSAEFESYWTSHEVIAQACGVKRIRHPTLGDLCFEHVSFQVNEKRRLKMVIYLPGDLATRAAMEAAGRALRSSP